MNSSHYASPLFALTTFCFSFLPSSLFSFLFSDSLSSLRYSLSSFHNLSSSTFIRLSSSLYSFSTSLSFSVPLFFSVILFFFYSHSLSHLFHLICFSPLPSLLPLICHPFHFFSILPFLLFSFPVLLTFLFFSFLFTRIYTVFSSPIPPSFLSFLPLLSILLFFPSSFSQPPSVPLSFLSLPFIPYSSLSYVHFSLTFASSPFVLPSFIFYHPL